MNNDKGLIITVLNEKHNIERLMKSILRQSKKPDEIVILDAGSTDGTYEALLGLQQSIGPSLKVLQKKGANIAEGRNIAIRVCNCPILAVTDFGCELSNKWFEEMTNLFDNNTNISVVGGVYQRSAPLTFFEKIVFLGFNIKIESFQEIITKNNFRSAVAISSRAIAFRKIIWEEVNGYPEFLTKWGEDTLFNRNIVDLGYSIVINKKALVCWENEKGFFDFFMKIRNYTFGDFENKVVNTLYIKSMARAFLILLSIAMFFVSFPIGIALSVVMGFIYLRKIGNLSSVKITEQLPFLPFCILLLISVDFFKSCLFLRFKL